MNNDKRSITEAIQELIAELLAMNPAGNRLQLIGGFRYRLLDQSCRMSNDIDYNWDGDLERKQKEVFSLLQRKLLPDVRARLHYEGDVREATGPDTESPVVKILEVAFYRRGVPNSRIEIPVEITTIPLLDTPVPQTKSGTVYPTISDADMVESKVLALLDRRKIEVRDIMDIYLFKDALLADSGDRIQTKFSMIHIEDSIVTERLSDISTRTDFYAKQLDEVVAEQLDPEAAASLKAGGGGAMILANVLDLLRTKLRLGKKESDESH